MAQYGAPKTPDYKLLAPAPNYEFLLVDVKEIPNDKGDFAYDASKDDPNKATKFEWKFEGRKGTPAEGVTIYKKTPSYLTTDPRNGWLIYSSAIDPTFDAKVGYASEDDFKQRVIGKPVILAISNTVPKPHKTSGEMVQYNQIDKPYPSTQPAMSLAEIAELAGMTVDNGAADQDIPF